MRDLPNVLRLGLVLALVAPIARLRGQDVAAKPDSSPPKVVRMTAPVELPMLNAGTEAAPLPAVEVMVNGKGPFRFGIETGARFLIITTAAAQRAGLAVPATGPAELHADSITIGPAMLGDVHLVVLPRAPRGVDGLLGLPAFQNLLLTLDYPRAIVRLSRDSLPAANGQTILPLTRAGDFWALPVAYAGHPIQTILDTRSTGAFALDPKVKSVLPWTSEPKPIGLAGGAGIPTTQIEAGTLGGDAVVGGYHIRSPEIILHQLPANYPSDPRLGAKVLKQFTVSLDQAHARIRLTREGPPTFELPPPS